MRLRNTDGSEGHFLGSEELKVVSWDQDMRVFRMCFACFENEDRLVRKRVRKARGNQAARSAASNNNVIVRRHWNAVSSRVREGTWMRSVVKYYVEGWRSGAGFQALSGVDFSLERTPPIRAGPQFNPKMRFDQQLPRGLIRPGRCGGIRRGISQIDINQVTYERNNSTSERNLKCRRKYPNIQANLPY
jgi:hypothetical protein